MGRSFCACNVSDDFNLELTLAHMECTKAEN